MSQLTVDSISPRAKRKPYLMIASLFHRPFALVTQAAM